MESVRYILGKLARDRTAALGALIIMLLIVVAIAAPVLATHPDDIFEFHPPERLLGPSAEHFFGTDRMGSDVYSRLLYGARITIAIAVIAIGVSVLIGVPIGLIAGYYRNWVSDALMRTSDIFLAVPQIVLAIAIAQTLGPSIENVILALSATYWPFWARLVYAETRSTLNETFIEASVALGASPMRVMVLHVLPNISSSVIVRTTTRHGRYNPDGGGAGLPGARPTRTQPGMGPHHRRIPRVPARGMVVRHRPGPCHLPGRHGLQPAGRRAARYPGSPDTAVLGWIAPWLTVPGGRVRVSRG